MSDVPEEKSRQPDGRFAKGHSGGPGRPRRIVKAAGDALDERAAEASGELFDMTIGLAREGDRAALKMLLDRVWPVGRARPMELAVPQINSVHDVVPAMAGIANAASTGEARPDEVAAATRVLTAYMQAIEITDHEQRLTTWEKSVGIKK